MGSLYPQVPNLFLEGGWLALGRAFLQLLLQAPPLAWSPVPPPSPCSLFRVWSGPLT